MQKFECAEVLTEATNDELLNSVKRLKNLLTNGLIKDYCARNWTLLLLAAEYGHLDMVKYLMDKGILY